jgi:hypothetical protein
MMNLLKTIKFNQEALNSLERVRVIKMRNYFNQNPQDREKLAYLKLEVITQAYNRMRRM